MTGHAAPREHVYLAPTHIGVTTLMHPNALKSRILAAYVNAERRPGVANAGWDVHSEYDSIRCEDVARWLIDHDPNAWAAWCHKYDMRFDPECDEFIDLSEWGFSLASQNGEWRGRDEYLQVGRDLTDRLGTMIDPNPQCWKKPAG